MKALLQRTALFVLTGFIGLSSAATSFAEVHFKELTFAEAKKLAAKEKKKIMIDYYTDWCGWCKVLDKKTYSDEKVGNIADAKFISVKINAEKGEGIELAKKSQISGYPTIIFYNADGSEVDRVVGYQDADRFARSLTLASSGGAKAVLEEVNGKKGSTDPAKWLIAADYYAENKQIDKAQQAFRKVVQYDPENKLKLREEAEYGVAFMTPGVEQWDLLEKALLAYPQREEGRQAIMLVLKHDLDDQKSDAALRLLEMWAMQHPDDQNTFNFFAWSAAEKGVMLEKAQEYAERAVQLSTNPSERAGALDTYAEVLFKLGRANEALLKEQEALSMLDPQKDAKMIKSLTAQQTKFQNAASVTNVANSTR